MKNPLGILDDRAIESDAGVGESTEQFYEKSFKSKEGDTYKQQKKYHK